MSDFIETRPQRLCLMCGRCCRAATTYIPHGELVKMAEEGDEGAKDFLSLFEPYPSIEAAREADAAIVDNVLKRLETAEEPQKDVTFYKCRYIQDNNLCGRYETRPQLCGRFPTSPWAIIPPGCGYEGYLFQCREEIKQKIRKFKEDLLEYEAVLKTEQNPERKAKLELAIKKINDIVAHYGKYGSADW